VPQSRIDGAVTIDVGAIGQLARSTRSRARRRIGAGASGRGSRSSSPRHGLTLRFFPQSFELSTSGGWIATRAGGTFATRLTHIDDLVESVRASARGDWVSRRLPGSGAGPRRPTGCCSARRGSSGSCTEAWVRVRPRPSTARGARCASPRSSAAPTPSARSPSPSSSRRTAGLIDALEARRTAPGDGRGALLTLGFESADHPVDPWLDRALEICREHGGEADEPGDAGAVRSWREGFFRMPYVRDMLVRLGIFTDTFESAVTWERFPAFHVAVTRAVEEALGEPCRVTCRLTHVYPDGPAPYFTVLAPARRGDEVAQWHEMKRAAGRAILDAGGTITHHHGVGRDHRPWYDAQRPDAFAAALRAAKQAARPRRGCSTPGC
jgi:alkyldihydroxyacetonephosphate synthase